MTVPTVQSEIFYPETDGQPMAENTKQFECITTLKGNLERIFLYDPNVFVAGDLFWYPVEGRPDIRQAPDVMVVFGRPKGHRRSYQQWLEGNIPPQVVFEIASPGNRPEEWEAKWEFYNQYGVEEYYLYDPEAGVWQGWVRRGGRLAPVGQMRGWVSPRLGVRFGEAEGTNMGLTAPDGTPFLSFVELAQMAFQERLAREQAEQQARRLAQRLRELGIDPDEL